MTQNHLDDSAHTNYNMKVRHAALMRSKQAVADLFVEEDTLSDDFKFWMHFELIRHLSARFAASPYAIFSGMALDYLSEENSALRDDLSPGNWPTADVEEVLAAASEKFEFWQNIQPNSGISSKIHGAWKRLYPLDEKYL